jgi:hypothetical protein
VKLFTKEFVEATPPPEKEGPPPGFETNVQDKENTKGKMKETEIPSQETKISSDKRIRGREGKGARNIPRNP